MKAIIDCNNFYCSCERLFQPHLDRQPVVVLSNNDGCIVSRSDEAKALGIPMAEPYFMAKPIISKNKVAVFSSNYHLYGDLSWRVMETLRVLLGARNVEVYSVDECFVELGHIPAHELREMALYLRHTIEQWTGIKVSVGVAPTKVLCKMANNWAKKHKQKTDCVVVLDTPERVQHVLNRTPVKDIWGVGRQYAKKLTDTWGIYDAFQLSRMSETFAHKHLGGVVGVRLIKELNSIPAKDLEEELVNKRMIATTRMFGTPVSTINDIKEAIATYTSRAAEKLRRQYCAAKGLSIFVVTKDQSHQQNFRQTGTISKHIMLPTATSATNELIKPAVQLVDDLFEQGQIYKKAGVMLSHIVPDSSIQGNLFVPEHKNGERKLMDMIDNINFSQRDDILKFASSGTTRDWKMRQEHRSPRYTTRWEELFEVG